MKGNKMNLGTEFIFLLFCFCKVVTSTDICDPDKNCKNCDYCGKNNNPKNYNSCFYYNIFCYETSSMYILYKNYKYSQYFKNEYIQYHEKDNDIKSFCGQTEYSLDSQEDFTLFDSSGKTFPKNKNMHCHYIITKSGEIKSAELEFKMSKNEKVNEDRHLKVIISNLVKYDSKNEEEPNFYSNSQIHSSPLTYLLSEITKIEIFIDFSESGYNQPEEIFQIKVNFNKDSKKSNAGAIGGAIGGLLALLLLFGLIYYCCCTKTVYVKEESTCQIF